MSRGDNLTIAYWFGKDVDGTRVSKRRPVTFQDSVLYKTTNSSKIRRYRQMVDGPSQTAIKPSLRLVRAGYRLADGGYLYEKPLIYSYRNDPARISHDMLREILKQNSRAFTNEAEARAIEKQFSSGSYHRSVPNGQGLVDRHDAWQARLPDLRQEQRPRL